MMNSLGFSTRPKMFRDIIIIIQIIIDTRTLSYLDKTILQSGCRVHIPNYMCERHFQNDGIQCTRPFHLFRESDILLSKVILPCFTDLLRSKMCSRTASEQVKRLQVSQIVHPRNSFAFCNIIKYTCGNMKHILGKSNNHDPYNSEIKLNEGF